MSNKKQDKISMIKAILNGTYKEPVESKMYFITVKNGIYTLEKAFSNHKDLVIGNEEQFEQWKKGNGNPGDKYFMTEFLGEPLVEYGNITCAPDVLPHIMSNRATSLEKKEPVKLIEVKNDEQPKEEVKPVEEKKQAGKLSEYGEKWAFSEESLMELNPRGRRFRELN